MKRPLRELVVGTDLIREEVPQDDRAFLEMLGGPVILRLEGRDASRVRVVSTLLHGNEPSGLRAVIRFLRAGDIPATNVLFFIGAVETALSDPMFGHRALPGERDANRCWTPPWDTPQGQVAQSALERIHAANPECLVDLHNNTGHNPAYGVAFHIGHAELSLVSLFADRIVHTPLELGTLVEATVEQFPSVTIECGRAGDVAADEAAWEGLWRYLDWDQIDFEKPATPLMLLEDPVRVCVRPEFHLAFGDAPIQDASLTISQNIDRHNFERLDAGSPIGWMQSGVDWPIEAFGPNGVDCSKQYFEEVSGVLRTRREFIPIMMTTNEAIAKSDCLFYAVRAATGLPSAASRLDREGGAR